jgi:hypothetical protein
VTTAHPAGLHYQCDQEPAERVTPLRASQLSALPIVGTVAELALPMRPETTTHAQRTPNRTAKEQAE